LRVITGKDVALMVKMGQKKSSANEKMNSFKESTEVQRGGRSVSLKGHKRGPEYTQIKRDDRPRH